MRVFQPTYTKSFKRAYLDACLPPKQTRTSAVWWAEFTVNGHAFRKSTGLRDKNAAQARAAQLLRDEELRAAGIETHGDTTRATLACLLDEYRAEMTRRRCAPKHVETTLARCAALTQGVPNMAALTPTTVRLGLERLRGASAKTINGYRTALSGFCAWLLREHRWSENPVEAVARAKDFAEGRKRRALTQDEQRRLLANGAPDHRNAYIIAINTGLRRAEIEALDLLRDFAFTEDGRCLVCVRAKTSKNRRDDLLPLPRGVFIERPSLIKFGNVVVRVKVPSMAVFRSDLKAAGIDPEGVDFHSLRVTFATNLARAGVPLTLTQRLMRHSDPALTSNVYTRLRIDDEQAAVDRANPDQQRAARDLGLGGPTVPDGVPCVFRRVEGRETNPPPGFSYLTA